MCLRGGTGMNNNYIKIIFSTLFFLIFCALGYYIGIDIKDELKKGRGSVDTHIHFHYNSCNDKSSTENKIQI